jgi:hypothetical protein
MRYHWVPPAHCHHNWFSLKDLSAAKEARARENQLRTRAQKYVRALKNVLMNNVSRETFLAAAWCSPSAFSGARHFLRTCDGEITSANNSAFSSV